MSVDVSLESVNELLRERTRRTPGLTACFYRTADGQWMPVTWHQLNESVGRLSAGLKRLGLTKSDHVAIMLPTSYEWELARLAVHRLGGVTIGIDPHSNSQCASHILNEVNPKLLIVDRAQRLGKIPPSTLDGTHIVLVRDEECLSLAGRQSIWSDLFAASGDAVPDAPDPVCGDDWATIVYTSGTTGTPKGIRFTHRQLMLACQSIVEAFPELQLGDKTICWLPMAHLFQRMFNLVSVSIGITSYFVEDARDLFDVLGEVQPALLIGVPRVFEKVGKLCDGRQLGWIEHLKFAITGSAPIAAGLLEALRDAGVVVLEAYGLTENAIPMATNRVKACRIGSVGKPFPRNTIRFADDGEILVKGPGLFDGYLRDDSACERFTNDGFYKTGDCGFLDADGFLYLTGRKTEIIKTSTGRKISPAQVEAVYGQSPLVDQVVVFGNGRKFLVALVTLDTERVKEELGGQRASSEPLPNDADLSVIKDLVARGFEALGKQLSPHERIVDFAILPRCLSVAEGELSSAGKTRRDVVAQKHQTLIEKMYQEHSTPAAAPQ